MINVLDTIGGRLYERASDGFLYQLVWIYDTGETYAKGSRRFELIAGVWEFAGMGEKCLPHHLTVTLSDDGSLKEDWELLDVNFTKEVTINELPLYVHFPYKSESFDLSLKRGTINLPWKLYDTSL